MNTKELALNKVLSTMHLRRPQREALVAFHEVMFNAVKPLSNMTLPEISLLFREKYPTWHLKNPSPEFTFHLATGVGKTRLIGAIMAYLFLSNESKNFIIITPRTEIIRKFIRDIQPESKKYIFVDAGLVGYPRVMNADTVISYENEAIYTGPRIWILTPQAFSTRDAKIKKRGCHEALSVVDYLKKLNDLVIFFDESHHLSFDSDSTSVWRQELQSLAPKFIAGTTASVDDPSGMNVIYSYDLKQCINERLYTKLVRIIAEKKDETMSDEDYDMIVLRYAWEKLSYKQKALNDYRKANNIHENIKAVMLVSCEDIPHAERVTGWLRHYLNSPHSVLLVHSRMKEAEYLHKLLEVEDSLSPIKVVVNVSKLNEGWDVPNIYVIAPLRAMASTTLVTQVMGRGLRLPYGNQVGNEDVDTLEVLCFGKETMQQICDKLLKEGYGTGIKVEEAPLNTSEPEKEFIPTKKYALSLVGTPKELRIPIIKHERALLDIDSISLPPMKAGSLHSFLISDPRDIKALNGSLAFDRDIFLGAVTTNVIKQCGFLSFAKHYNSVFSLVERFLVACGFREGAVPLDPEKVVHHIRNSFDTLNRQVTAKYITTDDDQVIDLTSVTINVPETFDKPIDSISFDQRKWERRIHRGIPFSGWKRSLFEAIPFDQPNELKIAKIIDRSSVVTWWIRNLPGLITFPTPAGNYSPDFAIFFIVDESHVLLEIKGDYLVAEASVKANAAKEWCKAQSLASGKPWSYWFLLDSDAMYCETFEDIRDNADKSDSF